MPDLEPLELDADFFPILPWDRLHGGKGPNAQRMHGLDSMAECHFTLGGFVLPEDLPLCEELGLKAIMATADSRVWTKLSDDEIDAKVQAMVEQAGDSEAVIGYYIMDEPGAEAFPALAKAVAAVKKYAPGKLAYINLFPDYATIGAPDISQLDTNSYTEYLERFVTEVKPQLISYDNYRVQYSQDLTKPEVAASYYNNLLEVRRVALKYGLPFWNIVSSNQIRAHTPVPSPANLHFQAYTTLAAGGRGVTWYKYYARGYGYAPIDENERKTVTWRYLQMVNHQVKALGPVMNRLTSTGVYFTDPPPVPSLPLLPGRLIQGVEVDVPMMVGEFTGDDGADYVMVVDLSLEQSAKFALKTAENRGFQIVSAENGEGIAADLERGLWLVAGQGMLIKLD